MLVRNSVTQKKIKSILTSTPIKFQITYKRISAVSYVEETRQQTSLTQW
jgi:hypothetical protein